MLQCLSCWRAGEGRDEDGNPWPVHCGTCPCCAPAGKIAIIIGATGLSRAIAYVVSEVGAAVVLPICPIADAVLDGLGAAHDLLDRYHGSTGELWRLDATAEFAEGLFRSMPPRALVEYVAHEGERA
jgi:hypothetical protein